MTTSIKVSMDQGAPSGTAKYIGVRDKYCVFECACGEEFTKYKYKPYTEAIVNLVCPSCRLYSRVGPYQAERQIFRRVQFDARSRGLAFDVTIEQFARIIHQACHYCGSLDKNSSQVILSHSDGTSFKTSYRYNGIDRMDNALGYIVENCVPCCFVCNRAKREMPYDDFLEWISSLVANWGMR